jgi:hypothetical protein
MAYTTEMIAPPPAPPSLEPSQFDLPVKEFIGYDPKGTTTVTGSERIVPQPANASQPNTTEAQGAAESPAPEESVTLSPKASALARREAAQRQKEQSLKQREKDLETKLALAEKYEQLQAKIKAKDFSALEAEGATYDEFVSYKLNKENPPSPEVQRVSKVEQELADLKKNQEEKTLRDWQDNQKLWKQEISKAVTGNEAYPTVSAYGQEALDAIQQHINDSFEEDGTELTVEQAAKDVEENLEAHLSRIAEKALSIPKIKEKLQGTAKVLGPPKPGAKTITQNMTVTSQQSKPKPFHLMSESEQLAEAIRRVNAAKLQR